MSGMKLSFHPSAYRGTEALEVNSPDGLMVLKSLKVRVDLIVFRVQISYGDCR